MASATQVNGKPKRARPRRLNSNGPAISATASAGKPKGVNGSKSAPKPEPYSAWKVGDASFRKRLFVEAYMGQANGNATEAARMVGFAAPEQAGYRLSNDDEVKGLIGQRLAEAALPANETLALLSEAALGPSADCFDPGTGHLDIRRIIEAGKVHMVKRCVTTKMGQIIEFVDAQGAQVALAKYHGLLVERHHHTVDVTLYDDPSQLDAIARGEDPGPPRQRPQLSGPVIDTTCTTQETAQDDPGSTSDTSVDRKTD